MKDVFYSILVTLIIAFLAGGEPAGIVAISKAHQQWIDSVMEGE